MKKEINLQVFHQFPELRTARLLLRETRLVDAEAMYTLRTDPQVRRYLDSPVPDSQQVIESRIRSNIGQFAEQKGINWVITLQENPATMIGYIGFWRLIPAHFRAEIGYALSPRYWRQGIMNEAMKRVLDWAFTIFGLHSIEANVNPANEASKQLLLRHGFQQEAYFRENYWYDGQFLDSAIFGLIKPDYLAQQSQHKS